MLSKLIDSLNEQEWYQELKGKWDELDPQSQLYLKLAVGIALILAVLMIMINALWSVHKMKVEFSEKNELLRMIQNANTELQQLKDTAASSSILAGAGDPWGLYFTNIAGSSGISKESLTISDEKNGSVTDLSKESLFDLNLKHVNIRQVVRYAFTLENGGRPIKLRNLQIDTKGDPEGYLDATLSVSTFALQANK